MGKLEWAVKAGPKSTHWCGVCDWLLTLDDETRDEANTLFKDEGWTPFVLLTEALEPLGLHSNRDEMWNHTRVARRG